jgi:hypothetical protein
VAYQQVNLSELAKVSGGTQRGREAELESPAEAKPKVETAPRVPITLTQQPLAVRQQLMMIKAETGKTIENQMAEAINDYFAKHGKPEIAVVKVKKGRNA